MDFEKIFPIDTDRHMCDCQRCGINMFYNQTAYQISNEDICICEDCYEEECSKERSKNIKCKICGEPYQDDLSMVEIPCEYHEDYILSEYYCADCFEAKRLKGLKKWKS